MSGGLPASARLAAAALGTWLAAGVVANAADTTATHGGRAGGPRAAANQDAGPSSLTGWAPAAALTGAARATWERCAAQLHVPVDQTVRVRRFGETRETTARILPLVMSGEKTITTTTPWVYDRDPGQRPAEGYYSVVVDADAEPVGVLRTIAVKTLPYESVTEDDTRHEGKPVRPLGVWREVHVRYFDRVLKPLGLGWRPDMPVTLERFEVVCREG